MSSEIKRLLEQNKYNEALSSIMGALPGVGVSEEGKERLASLYAALQETIRGCSGPFPADHGERHVIMVMSNLLALLRRAELSGKDNELELLFAAAMVHDLGMRRLNIDFENRADFPILRKQHAREENIRIGCEKQLEKYYRQQRVEILKIASAHAGDDKHTPEQKLRSLEHNHIGLVPLAKLLQAADFFDLGSHRILFDTDWVVWEKSQQEHLRKHKALEIELDAERGLVLARVRSGVPTHEEGQLYQRVCNDVTKIVTTLATSNLGNWTLHEAWEAYGARVEVEVVGSFRDKFNRELDDCSDSESFEIDLMGHSLFALFVEDKDGVLKRLSKLPRNANLQIRVLLLDPSHETQQMFEVAATQADSERGTGRSILPDYARPAGPDKGDILASIAAIHSWVDTLPETANVEVRLTRQLMYAAINRYRHTMLIQPYTGGGRTKGSALLLTRKDLSLFETYKAEFQRVWEDTSTSPLVRRAGEPPTPLSSVPTRARSSNLQYEDFVADVAIRQRITRWFRGEETPPLEIEIQTSSECQLACTHCIGAHLGHVRHWKPLPTVDKFLSSLEYATDEFRVERLRISGLYGDPLFGEAAALSCDLIEAAKRKRMNVVVFTNGLGLTPKVRELLIATLDHGDSCHVSVDAANARKYRDVKHRNAASSEDFDHIRENLKALAPRRFQLGVGFVLTEQNAPDIEDMARWTREDVRADFARFKLDVRGPLGVSWRSWARSREACKRLALEAGLPVYFTDSPWLPQFPGIQQRCWLQLLCPAISGDGLVYVCDHQVGRGEPLGDLSIEPFADIWKRHWDRSRKWMMDRSLRFPHGVSRNTLCTVCPPFGNYLNRHVEAERVGTSP